MGETPRDRLRKAINGWGTIVSFQREIARFPVRGTSRASIYSYLNGRTRPSPEFLEHASKILGVELRWLKTGRGPHLTPPNHALALQELSEQRRQMRELLSQQVEGVHRLDRVTFELFLHLLTRYTLGAPDGRGLLGTAEGERTLVELARDLMWLVNLPKDPNAWGFESLLERRREFDYYSAMFHALSLLLPDAGKGSPLDLRRDSLIPFLRLRGPWQINEQDQEETDGEDT